MLSSLTALPARKHFFRHRTDNSGPMTGSRLEAPVMGPEGGKKVGAFGNLGSMESAQHSPTLASGPAPPISHSSETDGHRGRENRHFARGPGAGGWRGRLIKYKA